MRIERDYFLCRFIKAHLYQIIKKKLDVENYTEIGKLHKYNTQYTH